MKVLFAGGGTGGSVTPLLAIQERYRKRHPDCQFLFIGTADGPERQLAETWRIPFYPISAGKLRRYWSWQNLVDPFRLLRGLGQAWSLLRRERPAVVVGAGSFVTVPVAYAAWLQRIPILMHQQDVLVGLANRLVAPLATTITTAYEATARELPSDKTLWTGNPVREDILTAGRRLGREIFSLEENRPTVLVFGGGTGAQRINQLVAEAASALVNRVQLIHLTGRGHQAVDIRHPRYHQYEFLTDTMGEAYAAADLVVCRAGLATISELSALGKPAIILPMPDSHQEVNARFLADRQAAVVLDQHSLTVGRFTDEVLAVAADQARQRQLSENIARLTHQDAVDSLIREIDQLLPPKPVNHYTHIHMAGIGGVGMAGAATILAAQGVTVTGADRVASPMTELLLASGIPVTISDDGQPTMPAGTDLLVYSLAVRPDAPDRLEAYRRRIEQTPYAMLVAKLLAGRQGVAISGTHGKTTTTAMIGEMAVAAGLDPTVLVGSRVKAFSGNARYGRGPLFIFEADEYGRSFLHYTPDIAVITTVDVDHLDTYHDITDIVEAFRQYVARLPKDGVIVVNANDQHALETLERAQARIITYGLGQGDVRAENIELRRDGTVFTVHGHEFHLSVLGDHNVANALAAIVVGRQLRLPWSVMAEGLKAFQGTWRRFEYLGEYQGRPVISDYAHHPREIQATMMAARQRYPERRPFVVFQPHQRERTERLYYAFLDVLKTIDAVVVAEIYAVPGREEHSTVSSRDLVREAEKFRRDIWYAADPTEAMKLVKKYSKPNDVILILGAGDIYQAAEQLVPKA